MKFTISLVMFLYLGLRLQAQHVYTITADSVKLTGCDSSELIIQNHTQNVPGFLFNTGNGRTIFKHAAQSLGNGSYVFGADTVQVGAPNAWLQGGNSFGTTGVLGTNDLNPVNLCSFCGYTQPNLQLMPYGRTLFGTTTDNGINTFQFNGSIYDSSGYYSNINAPLTGINNSGAIRLRWGTGDGAYLSFFNQGDLNRRAFMGTPSDSRPFYFQDQVGVTFGTSPFVAVGQEGSMNSKFSVYNSGSSLNDMAIERVNLNGVLVTDLLVSPAGNTILGGSSDNGYELQVNAGSGYGLYATGNAHVLSNVAVTVGYDAGSINVQHGIRVDSGYTSMIFESSGQGWNTDMFTFSSTGGPFAKPLYYQDGSIIKVSTGFSDANVGNLSGNVISLEPIYNAQNSVNLTLRGIYYNPTIQSMVGARNVAIETVTGDVLFGTTSGNVGVGTGSPTAQLHTTGSVRFAGLTQDSTQTNVLVADANGNLYYRSASGLADENPVRSSLAVNGTIKSHKIIISPDEWADYVFDSTYRLPELNDVESYIHREHHLPGIPSAVAVQKNSLDVGASQVALLKKIEELTLYTIDQQKKLEEQSRRLDEQEKRLTVLAATIKKLKKP